MKETANCGKFFWLMALVLGGVGWQTVFADTYTVSMGDYYFSPKNITVNLGDTIIWTNISGKHTVTGTGDEPMCGQTTIPVSCSETFVNAGVFPYICVPHVQKGMTGLVTVAGVSITTPVNGAVFAAPANITLAANAVTASNAVINVSFFLNANLLVSVTNPPFSLLITNLGVGQYTFTAVAFAGDSPSTSAPVTIRSIEPGTVSNTAVAITNGQFSFFYSADPGLSYVIQSSLDLINWSPLTTNLAITNAVQFTDSFDTNGMRFYRVGRLQNP